MIVLKVLFFIFSGISICFASSTGVINEGVTSQLTPDILKGLEDYIDYTKQDLDRAISRSDHSPFKDREIFLRQALDYQLNKTLKYTDEFLSRNVLYRAKEIHELLLKVPSDPKRNAFAIRFLTESLRKAQDLAPLDVVLTKSHQTEDLISGVPRIGLGLSWAKWMTNMSYSLPTNETHLATLKAVMGFFVRDVALDLDHHQYLANVANALKLKYEELEVERKKSLTPLEKLELIKSTREYLLDELNRAQTILTGLGQNNLATMEFEVAGSASLAPVATAPSPKKVEVPKVEVPKIADLGAQYTTSYRNQCETGYVPGEEFTNGSRNDSIICLRISNLGKSYTTAYRNTCLEGYISGEEFSNQWRYDSKHCLKK